MWFHIAEVNAAQAVPNLEFDHQCLHSALTNIGFALPKNPGVRNNWSDCLGTKSGLLFGRTPESRRSSTQHLLPPRDCGLCKRCWAQIRGDVFFFVELAYQFCRGTRANDDSFSCFNISPTCTPRKKGSFSPITPAPRGLWPLPISPALPPSMAEVVRGGTWAFPPLFSPFYGGGGTR